jgi:hypothetical protein
MSGVSNCFERTFLAQKRKLEAVGHDVLTVGHAGTDLVSRRLA